MRAVASQQFQGLNRNAARVGSTRRRVLNPTGSGLVDPNLARHCSKFLHKQPIRSSRRLPVTQDDESRRAARKAQNAAWRAANGEKLRAITARYRAANKEKLAASAATYRASKPQKPQTPEYQAAYRAALSPEKRAAYKAKQKARKQIYDKTPEGIAAAAKRKPAVAAYQKTAEYKTVRAAYRRRIAAKTRAAAALARAKPEAKAKDAAYRARPEVKAAKLARQQSSEFKAARAAKRAARYAEPMDRLKRRMSTAVRSCLRNPTSKAQVKWSTLVGYTPDELRRHIERQFLPKMGWHNFAEWHVDHIVPLSAFRFETTDDPDFKAAWALTNLRPLWIFANLSKHARREFLL